MWTQSHSASDNVIVLKSIFPTEESGFSQSRTLEQGEQAARRD
jgi:hypothetical protein